MSNNSDRPAREAFGGAPAQEARQRVDETGEGRRHGAQTAFDEAKARSSIDARKRCRRRGTTGAQRRLNVDDEVDRAVRRLDNAKAALGADRVEGLRRRRRRGVRSKVAELLVRWCQRLSAAQRGRLMKMLDKDGLPRVTGIADAMEWHEGH